MAEGRKAWSARLKEVCRGWATNRSVTRHPELEDAPAAAPAFALAGITDPEEMTSEPLDCMQTGVRWLSCRTSNMLTFTVAKLSNWACQMHRACIPCLPYIPCLPCLPCLPCIPCMHTVYMTERRLERLQRHTPRSTLSIGGTMHASMIPLHASQPSHVALVPHTLHLVAPCMHL